MLDAAIVTRSYEHWRRRRRRRSTDGVDWSDGGPRPGGSVAPRPVRSAARVRTGRAYVRPTLARGHRDRRAHRGPGRTGRASPTATAGPPLHRPPVGRGAHFQGGRHARGHILVLGERRVPWSYSEPALLTPVRKCPCPAPQCVEHNFWTSLYFTRDHFGVVSSTCTCKTKRGAKGRKHLTLFIGQANFFSEDLKKVSKNRRGFILKNVHLF